MFKQFGYWVGWNGIPISSVQQKLLLSFKGIACLNHTVTQSLHIAPRHIHLSPRLERPLASA